MPPTFISIASQKGGVGKTTLAFHLAMLGRERGLSVLVVDLDSQGNATLALTGDHRLLMERDGSNLLFTGDDIRPIETPLGVHLLHGHQLLDGVDHEVPVSDAPGMAARIRALPYDLVVFDTPPAVGLRQLAPMYWADRVVVPLEANSFAVSGLAHTLNTITTARQANPRLVYSLVINKLLTSSSRQRSYAEAIAKKAPVLAPHLTLRVSVEAAVDAGRPVWRFTPAPRPVRSAWLSVCSALLEEVPHV